MSYGIAKREIAMHQTASMGHANSSERYSKNNDNALYSSMFLNFFGNFLNEASKMGECFRKRFIGNHFF